MELKMRKFILITLLSILPTLLLASNPAIVLKNAKVKKCKTRKLITYCLFHTKGNTLSWFPILISQRDLKRGYKMSDHRIRTFLLNAHLNRVKVDVFLTGHPSGVFGVSADPNKLGSNGYSSFFITDLVNFNRPRK